jgi:DNA-directed RNA polymerase subunit E'/Rpb7
MFFIMKLTNFIKIKPEFCGPGYKEYCEARLKQVTENTVQDAAGMIVAVQDCVALDHGKMQEGTGLIMVTFSFKAIVLQLFKHEVVDCEVTEVQSLGVFAYLCRPSEFHQIEERQSKQGIHVLEDVQNSRKLLESEKAKALTLYVTRHPNVFEGAKVFVSKSSLPEGWDYSEEQLHSAGGPAYVSPDGGSRIRRETRMKVELIATKQHQDKLMAVGTTRGEDLGPYDS